MVLDRLHLHTIGPAGRGMCVLVVVVLLRVNACLLSDTQGVCQSRTPAVIGT